MVFLSTLLAILNIKSLFISEKNCSYKEPINYAYFKKIDKRIVIVDTKKFSKFFHFFIISLLLNIYLKFSPFNIETKKCKQ